MPRTLFKRKKKERAEAALLSFKLGYINLMITLVPFLLSIAVFSRLAILDLNLPKLDGAGEVSLNRPEMPRAEPLALTVAIEEDGVAVSNGSEQISFVKHRGGAPDAAALSTLMQQLKKDHPDAKEVVLLSRPKTVYADLVAVMDACRSFDRREGETRRVEMLFPDVSLGEVSS